jgi:superfamily I DNA and RNA helicase
VFIIINNNVITIRVPTFSSVGYLKLYQLSKPEITALQVANNNGNFDCILADEAQDFTPGTYTSNNKT